MSVKQITDCKGKLAKSKTDKDKDYFETRCVALHRQIDMLVYGLYGLSKDEINIVEGTAQPKEE